MLSGYRFFVFERDGAMKSGVKQVSIKLDDFGKS
jgi:hypothetical protein